MHSVVSTSMPSPPVMQAVSAGPRPWATGASSGYFAPGCTNIVTSARAAAAMTGSNAGSSRNRSLPERSGKAHRVDTASGPPSVRARSTSARADSVSRGSTQQVGSSLPPVRRCQLRTSVFTRAIARGPASLGRRLMAAACIAVTAQEVWVRIAWSIPVSSRLEICNSRSSNAGLRHIEGGPSRRLPDSASQSRKADITQPGSACVCASTTGVCVWCVMTPPPPRPAAGTCWPGRGQARRRTR